MTEAKKRELTAKQRAFIEAYIACLNASEAARIAGYSHASAYAIGHENLRKPEIMDEIIRKLKGFIMPSEEVLARLSEQARANMATFLDSRGNLDLSSEDAQNKMHLVKKYKVHEWTTGSGEREAQHKTVEIELHDAQSALGLMGKYHKLLTDKVELSGKDGAPLPITIVEIVTPGAKPE